MKRPAVSTVFPTIKGFCFLLDVGAAALEEVNAARRSGDTGRLERAYALAQDRSIAVPAVL